MNRRQFSWLFPCAVAGPGVFSGESGLAQTSGGQNQLVSGVYPAKTEHVAGEKRTSQAFLTGMLNPGLRLEAHESVLQPGAPPEETRKHLHSEIWFMKAGTAELWVDGVSHTMKAGDMGLVVAGGMHYVKNIGDVPVSYFVLAVGPPE
jgi:mannose-6-phosphate isomerase-like protein (cupin superfamily)